MNGQSNRSSFIESANRLAEVGRWFYRRGWALGTSGNFSTVLCRDPFRLAITASGIDKGELHADHILEVDREGVAIRGAGKPSAETLLHLSIARLRGAGAVLHTHSVWSNILSDLRAGEGGLAISGFEMLKGLEGVATHEQREWVPIVENSQDMLWLASAVEKSLNGHPSAHGFLIRRHGLYTWGQNLSEAKRHVEIFEFLLEVIGRQQLARP